MRKCRWCQLVVPRSRMGDLWRHVRKRHAIDFYLAQLPKRTAVVVLSAKTD